MMELVRQAIDKGPDGAASVEKLLGVYERLEDRQAKREFYSALAAFQAECPRILKTKMGNLAPYAPLEEIKEAIRPLLKEYGFSLTWDSEYIPEGSRMKGICKLRHGGGHSETTSFTGPTESRAGCSPLQKNGAAETYCVRRAVCSMLGIAPVGEDKDGADPEGRDRVKTLETLTDDQASYIEQLLSESGLEPKRLFKWISAIACREIKAISEIPRELYERTANKLQVTIDDQTVKRIDDQTAKRGQR
jgi:hypothetical protein